MKEDLENHVALTAEKSRENLSSTSAHTSGPLEYSPVQELDDGTAECIISAPHPTRPGCGFALATVQGFSVAETEIYARLFAAAPAMVEALEAIVAAWDRLYALINPRTAFPSPFAEMAEDVEFRELEIARAALSLAKGGA